MPWPEQLRQLLELLAAHADHRLHPLPWALPVPLRVHGHYNRADLLFVTLGKSESLFSPTSKRTIHQAERGERELRGRAVDGDPLAAGAGDPGGALRQAVRSWHSAHRMGCARLSGKWHE